MLALSRRVNESIIIGDDVVITVIEIRGDNVRLGITAPQEVTVHREEVYAEINGREAVPKPKGRRRPVDPAAPR